MGKYAPPVEPEALDELIEAILFASGEPIEIKTLADVLEQNYDDFLCKADDFTLKYNSKNKGLMILRLENKLQLCTRPEYGEYIRKTLDKRKDSPLSNAALEVIAIIAYNQPVTKIFIEQVRGVDSSYIVNSLVEKGLVEENGRLDAPGKPYLYRTTDNFLRCFNISSLEQLPPLEDAI